MILVRVYIHSNFQEVVLNMGYESYGGGYGGGSSSSFVLIVVLFILLIIVGASFSSGY